MFVDDVVLLVPIWEDLPHSPEWFVAECDAA